MLIGGCLISASYPYLADIYQKKRTNTSSGQIVYEWQFLKTIPCLVSAFQSTSFKAQGITEDFSEHYKKQAFLRMFTSENLGRNVQVANIRDAVTGVAIFTEIEAKGNPYTWFNSNGSSPVLDPFGRIFQWDTLIHRAESQGGKQVV